jgi:hypothetical protein
MRQIRPLTRGKLLVWRLFKGVTGSVPPADQSKAFWEAKAHLEKLHCIDSKSETLHIGSNRKFSRELLLKRFEP